MTNFLSSHIGNFFKGRNGHKIIRGYFHRTAVRGDTALEEANYFHNHCVQASFYKVIDLKGSVIQTVYSIDTEFAVNQWQENEISVSFEFTGLEGTPLTKAQIATAIREINTDPALKGIAKRRLTVQELPGRVVSGWANHRDVTNAYNIANGHIDGISELEIRTILKGIK